ncbi:hypothetical protein [Chryseobacterium sp. ERMR1:04]|uniref:hypothetical protein n=1 Tax=Chryseobacterium sp. ERMR1:04 TaxID=1705393 RepID=UPI0006C8BD6D|nr:hypothetical protein [Chryseobacterium sp. ERMR1:04]KPH13470.1 hypothetical protein AMQ68_07755 [Chryseobacterium sp. ERMR1:04]
MRLLKLIFLILLLQIYKGQDKKRTIKSEEIISYEFNRNNKLFKRRDINYGEFSTFNHKGQLQEKGVLIWDYSTQKDERRIIERYHYKDTLLVGMEKFRESSGEKYQEMENQFNEAHKLEKKIVRSFENGKEVFKKNSSLYMNIEYDNNSQIGKMYEYDEDTKEFKLAETSISTFDNKQNLKEKKIIDSDNKVFEIKTFEYNKNEKVIKYTSTISQANPNITYYSYNSNNDPIKLTNTFGNNKIEITCSYKYDDNSNWIEKTQCTDGEEYLVTRKIEYY